MQHIGQVFSGGVLKPIPYNNDFKMCNDFKN